MPPQGVDFTRWRAGNPMGLPRSHGIAIPRFPLQVVVAPDYADPARRSVSPPAGVANSARTICAFGSCSRINATRRSRSNFKWRHEFLHRVNVAPGAAAVGAPVQLRDGSGRITQAIRQQRGGDAASSSVHRWHQLSGRQPAPAVQAKIAAGGDLSFLCVTQSPRTG